MKPEKKRSFCVPFLKIFYPDKGILIEIYILTLAGMYLIMDFVPNHSSDKHEWFIASSDPTHPDHETYKDYYIWVDGPQGTYPNNWVMLLLKHT